MITKYLMIELELAKMISRQQRLINDFKTKNDDKS